MNIKFGGTAITYQWLIIAHLFFSTGRNLNFSFSAKKKKTFFGRWLSHWFGQVNV